MGSGQSQAQRVNRLPGRAQLPGAHRARQLIAGDATGCVHVQRPCQELVLQHRQAHFDIAFMHVVVTKHFCHRIGQRGWHQSVRPRAGTRQQIDRRINALLAPVKTEGHRHVTRWHVERSAGDARRSGVLAHVLVGVGLVLDIVDRRGAGATDTEGVECGAGLSGQNFILIQRVDLSRGGETGRAHDLRAAAVDSLLQGQ